MVDDPDVRKLLGGEESAKSNVTEDEMRAAWTVAAPYVNKMLVTTTGGIMVRLSFLERRSGADPQARAAVTMHIGDFLAVREVINRVADRLVEDADLAVELEEPISG